MKLICATYLLALFLLPVRCWGQVDSTATDSLSSPAVTDTLISSAADTLQADSAEVIFKVTPWDYHAPLGADVASSDSTLRWQLWPSWTYKKNRDPGIISYRLGTIGRTNTQLLDAHEPQYQHLYWQDISLTDPVSGITNWNYIPHHKVSVLYEDDQGVIHQTRFYLREYYLNKPLTQLNYNESSFDTRSLEFVVSRNFGQKTNAELSYWDRRDGGEYSNSGAVGRQIYARVSHQLDARQELTFNLLNNNYDTSLPFGYVLPADPAAFSFDRFEAIPNERTGSSDRGSTVLGLNYYRRPADTTRTTSNFHAGLYSNSAKREVTYSADSVSYKVQELGASIRKWQQLGPLILEAGASYGYFINKEEGDSTLVTDNWGLLKAEGKASINAIPLLHLDGFGHYRSRSDGFSDYRMGVNASLSFGKRVKISAGYASGTHMPTPQQLYWQSDEFHGNANLKEETIQALQGRLEVAPFAGSTLGVKAQLKQIDGGIMINTDSTFANTNGYSSLSTTGFMDYSSTHFEFTGSATIHRFGNYLTSRNTPLPVDDTERIWFKGSAYVKGYLFDRATYVKGGLAGMITPQSYQPARYYPSLDFWQSSGSDFIPSFNRLDVDLSARVRSIMVLLRYENVLDDLVQQGYFETSGYPMTGRRFIFGIRVLFRN